MSCCEDCNLEYGPPEGVDLPADWHDLAPHQRYYYRNKEKKLQRNKKARVEKRKYIQSIKTKRGCKECAFDDHYAALEFHHLENKDMKISDMPRKGYSIEKISEEISKCEILCANCHRLRHSKG